MKLITLVPSPIRRALRLRDVPAQSYAQISWPDNWFQSGSSMPTGDTAMANSAVFAAIDRISSDIAKVPLRHWRVRPDGRGREEVVNSQQVAVWRAPNPHQTHFDIIKALVTSQLYRGNGYAYAMLNGKNQVVELHALSPDRCYPYVTPEGEVFYRLAVDWLAEIQSSQFVPARYILHHRMMTISSSVYGISPLMAAMASITQGSAIQNFGAAFFANMARPGGYLTTENKIDRQKAAEIAKQWRDSYQGAANAGKTAVLEQGLQYKQLTASATDSQLIDQLNYTVTQVARVFQIPPLLLAETTGSTVKSAEQMMRIYYSSCLSPHFEALEERINAFFELDETKEYLEFDINELFKTDFDVLVAGWKNAVQGGLATPNEGRAACFQLNPVEGGDQVFMQQQMIPITMLGKVSLPGGAVPPSSDAAASPDKTAPAPSADEVKQALEAEVQRRIARWAA